jgi:hypothetical protein
VARGPGSVFLDEAVVMSKNETRGGSSALPRGQSKRGFSDTDSVNPKTNGSMMSIGTPTDGGVITSPGVGRQSLTAGFPGEQSTNAVKDGDQWLPDDSKVNRGYAYTDDGQNVDVGGIVDVGANRQRFGISVPPVPDAGTGIAWYDNSGNGPGTSANPPQQQ